MSCLRFNRVTPTPAPPSSSPSPGIIPGRTTLVTDATARPVRTANQETDARTALTRGLAEYIGQLSIFMNEQLLALKKVLEVFADPSEFAEYPAACVYSDDVGSYDSSKFQRNPPDPRYAVDGPDGKLYLVSAAEMVLDMKVEIYATEALERMALVAMLEEGLTATPFVGAGVRLELPHYFGQRGEYEIRTISYADADLEAAQRFRVAKIIVRGRVPLTSAVAAPMANIGVRLTVKDGP